MQTLVVECLRASLLGGYKALKPTYGNPVTSIMVENWLSAGKPARQASCDARASPSPFPLTKPGPPRGSSRVGGEAAQQPLLRDREEVSEDPGLLHAVAVAALDVGPLRSTHKHHPFDAERLIHEQTTAPLRGMRQAAHSSATND